jgi:DNA-binding CsgD family transcriptional regulator
MAENKDDQKDIMAFLELLELDGERLSDVPVWEERIQEVLQQLPEDVVQGFAARIRQVNGRTLADYKAFGERFGLTPAETKVLSGLASGLSTKEYAEKHDLSANTVRTHVQRILEKTEAPTQAELMRMLYTS